MEADETKRQGRMTRNFRFAHRFRTMKSTSLAFSAITRNKIPLNLLPMKIFNYFVFRNVHTHEIFYAYGKTNFTVLKITKLLHK